MRLHLIILFLLSSNFCSSQTIEFDTLMQDSRIPGIARVSNDTTIKTFPTADKYKFPHLIQEIQSRIKPDNYSTADNIGLTVLISKSGTLEKITIINGHYNECIVEAIRVIKTFKIWTPATYEYYLTPRYEGKATFIGDLNLSFSLQMKK